MLLYCLYVCIVSGQLAFCINKFDLIWFDLIEYVIICVVYIFLLFVCLFVLSIHRRICLQNKLYIV